MDVWGLKAIKVDNPPEDWYWTCPVGEPIYELYLSVDGHGGGAPLRGAVTREELNRLVESLSRLTAEMIACMGRARQEPKNPLGVRAYGHDRRRRAAV